jgi:hypothetical protein
MTEDELSLIADIASRAYTARELMDTYQLDRESLLAFRDAHIEEITNASNVNVEAITVEDIETEIVNRSMSIGELLSQLSDVDITALWIAKKSQRILRYQTVVDVLFRTPLEKWDSTTIREIRSYLAAVAEELGQVPNRGSATDGEDTRATYTITGVDPDELR